MLRLPNRSAGTETDWRNGRGRMGRALDCGSRVAGSASDWPVYVRHPVGIATSTPSGLFPVGLGPGAEVLGTKDEGPLGFGLLWSPYPGR